MLKHSFSHPFDLDKARNVAKHAVAYYQNKYPRYTIRLTWTSDTQAELRIEINGISLHGHIALEDRFIHAKLSIPMILRPFREQALQKIETEMKRWFHQEELPSKGT